MPRPILLTLLIFLSITTTAQLRPPSDKVLQKFGAIYAVKAADTLFPEAGLLVVTTKAFSLDDEDVNQAVGLILEEHKSFRDTAALRMLVTETIDRFIAANGLLQHCSPNFQQGRPALQLFTHYMCDCMAQLQQSAGDGVKPVLIGTAYGHCLERFRANDSRLKQFRTEMDTAGIVVKELQTCISAYLITNCTYYREKLIGVCVEVALLQYRKFKNRALNAFLTKWEAAERQGKIGDISRYLFPTDRAWQQFNTAFTATHTALDNNSKHRCSYYPEISNEGSALTINLFINEATIQFIEQLRFQVRWSGQHYEFTDVVLVPPAQIKGKETLIRDIRQRHELDVK